MEKITCSSLTHRRHCNGNPMKERRSGKAESVHIREVLQAILSTCRKDSPTELDAIRRVWNASFHPAVAEGAQPSALRNQTLFITVKSSTLAHQLRFKRQDIIDAINNALGADRVKDIKLKTGQF